MKNEGIFNEMEWSEGMSDVEAWGQGQEQRFQISKRIPPNLLLSGFLTSSPSPSVRKSIHDCC